MNIGTWTSTPYLTFAILIVVMAIAIVKYGVDVHVPMFIGVIAAACMALYLGNAWDAIERAMMNGIYNALQSVMILMIVGILIGVWIVGGIVPSMIYYGLKLLSPSVFLVAAVLICSITSLATGTSWGTMGTMGLRCHRFRILRIWHLRWPAQTCSPM